MKNRTKAGCGTEDEIELTVRIATNYCCDNVDVAMITSPSIVGPMSVESKTSFHAGGRATDRGSMADKTCATVNNRQRMRFEDVPCVTPQTCRMC